MDKQAIRGKILNNITVLDDGCWEWNKCKSDWGYGIIAVPDGYGKFKTQLAHRVSYEIFRGKIPDGLEIDHLCRKKDCCNPAHLEPVDRWTNNIRAIPFRKERYGKDHHNGQKTKCPKGHPYTPENTYTYSDGRRACRVCRKQHARKQKEKQRERHESCQNASA